MSADGEVCVMKILHGDVLDLQARDREALSDRKQLLRPAGRGVSPSQTLQRSELWRVPVNNSLQQLFLQSAVHHGEPRK